jgi:hypothetical protein
MLSHTRLDLRGLKFRLATFITVFQNILIPKSLEMCPCALILGAACLEAIVRLSWHCSSYNNKILRIQLPPSQLFIGSYKLKLHALCFEVRSFLIRY